MLTGCLGLIKSDHICMLVTKIGFELEINMRDSVYICSIPASQYWGPTTTKLYDVINGLPAASPLIFEVVPLHMDMLEVMRLDEGGEQFI